MAYISESFTADSYVVAIVTEQTEGDA